MPENNDTWKAGSSPAQIIDFSKRIRRLTEHLKEHHHDYHSRHRLMILIGKRKSHIKYLQRKDPDTYKLVADHAGIR